MKPKDPLYQDIPLFNIYVMQIDEMLAEKIRALLTRKRVKARDVYDIYYLLNFKHVKPDVELIKHKLDIYSKEFSKDDIVERAESIGSGPWKSELSNIIRTVPDYDSVVKYLTLHL